MAPKRKSRSRRSPSGADRSRASSAGRSPGSNASVAGQSHNNEADCITISICLPRGHTSDGLRGDSWGFNNFLAYNKFGTALAVFQSSSGLSGDLSMMDHQWLDKRRDHFWARVPASVVMIACATQGARQLVISVKGPKELESTIPAVHWSDQRHMDNDTWSAAHNRPDHFREWAYNVFAIHPPEGRLSKFSKITQTCAKPKHIVVQASKPMSIEDGPMMVSFSSLAGEEVSKLTLEPDEEARGFCRRLAADLGEEPECLHIVMSDGSILRDSPDDVSLRDRLEGGRVTGEAPTGGAVVSEAAVAEQVKLAFRDFFDTDLTGAINEEELSEVLRKCDPTLNEEKLQALFQQADQNADGSLQYEEFIDFVCGLGGYTSDIHKK